LLTPRSATNSVLGYIVGSALKGSASEAVQGTVAGQAVDLLTYSAWWDTTFAGCMAGHGQPLGPKSRHTDWALRPADRRMPSTGHSGARNGNRGRDIGEIVKYRITPEHFGYTLRLKLFLGVGSLGCFALPAIAYSLMSISQDRIWIDALSSLLTWLVFVVWWTLENNYSLEVNDNDIRVGGRVVRSGHVRYVREVSRRLSRGPGLQLAEHGSLWVHFLGGVIVIPKSLPNYEAIKGRVATWVVDSGAPHFRQ